MEQEKIKELLVKFYEGATSEEEEAQLREYLSDPAVASIFPEGEYLLSYRTDIPEPSEEFLAKLEAVTHMERKMTTRGRLMRYSMTIAAGAALLLGTYFLFNYLRPQQMRDTYSDPELAMAEVKNILTMVSKNMNTGTGALSSIRTMSITPEAMSEFGRLNKAVGKNLDKLRYLEGINTSTKTTENN
jgi:hypothetical protein